MRIKLILVMAVVLLANLVSAQHAMPVNCEELFDNNQLVPDTEFEELADICFYGTGFSDETVTVSLEGDNTVSEEFQTSNGILSSIVSGFEQFFSNVASGIYRMVVSMTGGDVEYSEDIIVTSDETENPDEGEENVEVPEFSTIAAGLALVGAGLIVRKKRKKV